MSFDFRWRFPERKAQVWVRIAMVKCMGRLLRGCWSQVLVSGLSEVRTLLGPKPKVFCTVMPRTRWSPESLRGDSVAAQGSFCTRCRIDRSPVGHWVQEPPRWILRTRTRIIVCTRVCRWHAIAMTVTYSSVIPGVAPLPLFPVILPYCLSSMQGIRLACTPYCAWPQSHAECRGE